jgi:hypothetical protein
MGFASGERAFQGHLKLWTVTSVHKLPPISFSGCVFSYDREIAQGLTFDGMLFLGLAFVFQPQSGCFFPSSVLSALCRVLPWERRDWPRTGSLTLKGGCAGTTAEFCSLEIDSYPFDCFCLRRKSHITGVTREEAEEGWPLHTDGGCYKIQVV